jgi:hypothetical protein
MLASTLSVPPVLFTYDALTAPWLNLSRYYVRSLPTCSRYVGRPTQRCVSSWAGDIALPRLRETVNQLSLY